MPVCSHHIHYLPPQLWPAPETVQLPPLSADLRGGFSDSAGSFGSEGGHLGTAAGSAACSYHDALSLCDQLIFFEHSCK